MVTTNTNDSGLLVRYRRTDGPGVDPLDSFLDGLLRRDVGHALAILVSPLVVLFHPLDPLSVRVVEDLETYRFGLTSAEFLVRAQAIEQASHELRKTEVLTTARASTSIFLLSITRHGICF